MPNRYMKKLSQLVLLAIVFGMYGSHFALANEVSKLVITSPPQTVNANQCSKAIQVQTQDYNSVLTNVTARTYVDFTGSSPDLIFYKDSLCTTPISYLYMPARTNHFN